MSTSKNSIKKFIDVTASKYPGSSFRYEFIEDSETHVIEVVPSELALKNNSFAEDQFSFVNYFLEKFPNENICFVTEEDLIRVTNPIYQSEPCEPFNMVGLLDTLLKDFDVKISNKTKQIIYLESFQLSESLTKHFIKDVRIKIKKMKEFNEASLMDLKTPDPTSAVEASKTQVGEPNYAMAA